MDARRQRRLLVDENNFSGSRVVNVIVAVDVVFDVVIVVTVRAVDSSSGPREKSDCGAPLRIT